MTDSLLRFATAKHWHTWLSKHHGSPDAVWLELGKKGSGLKTLSYAEAVEVALCWGWIDGQKGAIDGRSWKQRFTPRRKASPWSKLNRAKATELIADGRMQPPGLAEVERAKADGRLANAYASPKHATVPEDLAAALAKSPKAEARFETLDSANRYAILYRIISVKRPETRARNLANAVARLAKGEVPFPQRLPKAERERVRKK